MTYATINLNRFLETVAADAPHAMMSIGSIALFARNAEMSRLQTVLGLILDDAGATDEASIARSSY